MRFVMRVLAFSLLLSAHFLSPVYEKIIDAIKKNDSAPFIDIQEKTILEKDIHGQTLLHIAAFYHAYTVLPVLLTRTNQIDIEDGEGSTPLHKAIGSEEDDVTAEKKTLTCLLTNEPKAQVNAQNNSGNTPLHVAVEWEDVAIIRLLLSHGANPKILNNDGDKPIHLTSDKNIMRELQTQETTT